MLMRSFVLCTALAGAAAPMAFAQLLNQPVPQQAQPNPPRQVQPATIKSAPKAVTPVDPDLDVRAALEAAKAKAKAGTKRIAIFWMRDPRGEFTNQLTDLTRTPDLQKILAMEYVTVWAEVSTGAKAAGNRELAKSLGAEIAPTGEQGVLTVLDDQGKLVATTPMEEMIDQTRPRAYASFKIQLFLRKNAVPAPVAQALVDAAAARAKGEGKFMIVVFGEYGDPWTIKFLAWLAQPEVVKSLGKYAVTQPIELLRDVGATELLTKYGGAHADSLPWWAIVGNEGKLVAASQSDKMPNIGFPTDDGEINAFLGLLRRGNPKIADSDASAIRGSLVEHRQRKDQ